MSRNLILNRPLTRVQSSCSLEITSLATLDRNRFATIPYTGKVVPVAQLPYEIAMLRKGNILQYKKNSSNLTKKQQYSLIAQGKWYYRKTWASQSSTGYTNPNTGSLQRVNSETVELFPNSDRPVYVQDFGTLVCGTIENPVTGTVTTNAVAPNCHPTTDSNVPGKIMDLCWNDGITPWFPRTRYNMSSSNSKLNIDYKLNSALKFEGVTLTSTLICPINSIKLDWTYTNTCISAQGFNIYQNDVLIYSLPALQKSITFVPTNIQGNLIYYVTATNRYYESAQSNVVIVNTSLGFVINDANVDNIIVTTNSLTILANLTIEVICNIGSNTINIFCVGGGGGGGGGTFGLDNGGGGGGGGGGLITEAIGFVPTATTYSINIGAAGPGGAGGYMANNTIFAGSAGTSGGNTSIVGGTTNIIAAGGQGGKGNGQNTSTSGGPGGDSTGAGGTGGTVTTYIPPITSVNGGNGTDGGGGGGGSGGSGGRGKGGNGAVNIPTTNYGTIYGAGGGGGGANNESGVGGNENAGNGGDSQTLKGFDGIPNTGGGGGGGEGSNGSVERNGGSGGNGGSGIVIIYV